MIINTVSAKSIMTKSKLPESDYAVNPYVGCPHGCKYCYASFMKRFTNHKEPWGEFIDVKEFPKIRNPKKYEGKSIFIGSVTDSYNCYEEHFKKTQSILGQFIGVDTEITITTKSNLVVRDLGLLKQLKNVTVAFSINTVDEEFRSDMDKASSIQERIEAMRYLHGNGIRTVTFISPIFPGITDVREIVDATSRYCDEYWLENLNLRGSTKATIFAYIQEKYPELMPLYQEIYGKKNMQYWMVLSEELESFASEEKLTMINYFYHELIRKN